MGAGRARGDTPSSTGIGWRCAGSCLLELASASVNSSPVTAQCKSTRDPCLPSCAVRSLFVGVLGCLVGVEVDESSSSVSFCVRLSRRRSLRNLSAAGSSAGGTPSLCRETGT